jgi:hypothetical protein
MSERFMKDAILVSMPYNPAESYDREAGESGTFGSGVYFLFQEFLKFWKRKSPNN